MASRHALLAGGVSGLPPVVFTSTLSGAVVRRVDPKSIRHRHGASRPAGDDAGLSPDEQAGLLRERIAMLRREISVLQRSLVLVQARDDGGRKALELRIQTLRRDLKTLRKQRADLRGKTPASGVPAAGAGKASAGDAKRIAPATPAAATSPAKAESGERP